MPELPEVEIASRNLRRWLGKRRLTEVELPPSRILIFSGAQDEHMRGPRHSPYRRRTTFAGRPIGVYDLQ